MAKMIRTDRDVTEFVPFMAYGGLSVFKIDDTLWDMWREDAELRRYLAMPEVSDGSDLDASL